MPNGHAEVLRTVIEFGPYAVLVYSKNLLTQLR